MTIILYLIYTASLCFLIANSFIAHAVNMIELFDSVKQSVLHLNDLHQSIMENAKLLGQFMHEFLEKKSYYLMSEDQPDITMNDSPITGDSRNNSPTAGDSGNASGNTNPGTDLNPNLNYESDNNNAEPTNQNPNPNPITSDSDSGSYDPYHDSEDDDPGSDVDIKNPHRLDVSYPGDVVANNEPQPARIAKDLVSAHSKLKEAFQPGGAAEKTDSISSTSVPLLDPNTGLSEREIERVKDYVMNGENMGKYQPESRDPDEIIVDKELVRKINLYIRDDHLDVELSDSGPDEGYDDN